MSIATVIVAIGFVLVLVSIIMTSVAMNFKMRNMNVYSKDSFYSAEQVLDEIQVGLEDMVQTGLNSSYVKILSTYGSEDLSALAKNELVKEEFYKYIQDQLGNGSTSTYIAMPVDNSATENLGIYGLLKSSTRWHENADESYGAFLRNYTKDSDGTSYTGKMTMYQNEGIVLKDLVVYYKDPNGFVSTIKTDIHLYYPGFAFSNPEMPEIGEYAFITDTLLTNLSDTQVNTWREKETGPGRKSAAYTYTVAGKSYAYEILTSGIKFDYPKTKYAPENQIVATNFIVNSGGITTNDSTELWVGDIVAKSSDANLNGYIRVADDLNLKGKDSRAVINGYYIGWGNSLTDPYSSSAILANGTGTALNFENAKKLVLAGRSFVDFDSDSAKRYNKVTDAEGNVKDSKADKDSKDEKKNFFYTGESISSKSNQIMYLIPKECIGKDPVDHEYFECDHSNPMVVGSSGPSVEGNVGSLSALYLAYKEKYPDYAGSEMDFRSKDITKWIDLSTPYSRLGTALDVNTFAYYADPVEPVKLEYMQSSKGSTIVYFYINFADDEKANLFFSRYYGLNQTAIDKYMNMYLKEISIPGSYNKLSVVGEMVEDVEPGDEAAGIPAKRALTGEYYEKGSEDVMIADAYQDQFDDYLSKFEGLCTKLSPDLETLIDNGAAVHNGDDKALFSNIVSEDSLKEIIGTTVLASEKVLKLKDDKGDVRVILINGRNEYDPATKKWDFANYTLDSGELNTCNLVVSNCSVTIGGGNTFEGCMIVKGSITVPSGNYTFKANEKKVDECLNLQTEDQVYSVYEIFFDSDDLAFATGKESDTGKIQITDLVKLENWSKSIAIE